MKAYYIFTSNGPLVMLTSYTHITDPELLKRLISKGIDKFVACELPVPLAKERYGNYFNVICRDLYEVDDLRILDYNGTRVFRSFAFAELGTPIYHESSGGSGIPGLDIEPEMHLAAALSEMDSDEW